MADYDRIILDTGDGAAVTFLGAPENALFAGLRVRDSGAWHQEHREAHNGHAHSSSHPAVLRYVLTNDNAGPTWPGVIA